MNNDAILRTVFDLRMDSEQLTRPIQNRVSAFSRLNLARLLEQGMNPFDAPGVMFAFERIELDLGNMQEATLEQQLTQEIPRALQKVLRGLVGAHSVPGELQPGDTPDQAALQSLLQFLNGSECASPEIIVQAALEQWPATLCRLILDHGRKQSVRKRLAQLLSTPLLAHLVRLLAPEQADVIIAYIGDIEVTHAHRPLVKESRQEFRHALWEFVLAYLILERGSYFNTKALIANTLAQMAGRYQIAYSDLLQALIDCIDLPGVTLSARYPLPAILLELHGEQETPAQRSLAVEPLPLARKRLDSIAWFLQHGLLPWSDTGGARPAIADLLAQALEQSPDQLAALLRRIGHQDSVRQRLAHQFSAPLLEQVVGVLEPSDALWIIGTIHQIEKVQERHVIVQDDDIRFSKALWSFVLHALLVKRGSYFNTRSYIKSLLQRMSSHYSIAYADLLLSLIAAALDKTRPAARQDALPSILLSLEQELTGREERRDADVARPGATKMDKAARELLLRSVLGENAAGAVNPRFIDDLLDRMAARYGVAREHVLKLAQTGMVRAARQDTITAILLSLREELLSDAAARNSGTTQREIPNFARAAREFVIRGWFEERGSYFNQRSFIKNLLHSLAQRHGLAYRDLLLGLLEQTAPALRARMNPTELPGILWSLNDELATPEPAPAPPPEQELNLVFLEHGILPAAGIAPAQWQRLLTRGLWLGNGKRFVAALRKMSRHDEVIERLLNYLPQQRLVQLLVLLAPEYGGFIHTFLLAAAGLEQEGTLSPGQRSRVSRLHWQAALRFLLAHPGGTFSLSRFIAANSIEASRKLGLTVSGYRTQLHEIATRRAGSNARYRPLLDLLEQDHSANAGTDLAADASDAHETEECFPDQYDNAAPLQAFHTWLRYGRRNGTHAAFEARIAQAISQHPDALRTLLLRAAGSALERARIAHLLTAPLRERLLRLLLGQHNALLHPWQTWLAAALKASAPERDWPALLAEELLRQFAQERGSALAPAACIERLMQRLEQEHRIVAAALIQRLDREIARSPAHERDAAQALLDGIERRLAQKKPAAKRPRPEPGRETAASGDVLHIRNAGMVLLWPFLERYFHGLHMLDGKRFIGFPEQCRAVHLLQYLCSGDIAAPEHDLLLNKILCGLNSEAVLEVGGPLGEDERALSGQLLHNLTQHWEKLKNTSPDGLRETFLMREGRLERREHGWQLTVKPAAFDVLLASLPWSLSTIKLSWMEEAIWSQWK